MNLSLSCFAFDHRVEVYSYGQGYAAEHKGDREIGQGGRGRGRGCPQGRGVCVCVWGRRDRTVRVMHTIPPQRECLSIAYILKVFVVGHHGLREAEEKLI